MGESSVRRGKSVAAPSGVPLTLAAGVAALILVGVDTGRPPRPPSAS